MRNSYWETFKEVHGVSPIEKVTFEESDADIFSPSRGFVGDFDFTMQIQVGCPGGCLFCYVPTPGGFLTPASVRGPMGTWWGSVVRNKRRVPAKLQSALRKGRIADSRIYFSGITDPYCGNPRVTKCIWKILSEAPSEQRPRRIVVQRRFRPDRDRNLMAAYEEQTIPTDQGLQ